MDDIFDENFLQEICSFQNTNTIYSNDNIVPSQEITTPRGHRASCHRCGNIRKNVIKCSECPHVFCIKCGDKMMNEHGNNVFNKGCPLCKDLCCCGSRKSQDCQNIFHCYKKCMKGRCSSPSISNHSYSPVSYKHVNKFSAIPEYSKQISPATYSIQQSNPMQYVYIPQQQEGCKQQVKFDDMCISFDDSENEIKHSRTNNILDASNSNSFCNPILESLLGPLAPAIVVSNSNLITSSANESNDDGFKMKSNLTPINTNFTYYSDDSTMMTTNEYKPTTATNTESQSDNISTDTLTYQQQQQQQRSSNDNTISQTSSSQINNISNEETSDTTYQQLLNDSSTLDYNSSKNKRMKLMPDDLCRNIMNESNNNEYNEVNNNNHNHHMNQHKHSSYNTNTTTTPYPIYYNNNNTIPTIFSPHNLTETNTNPFFVQSSLATTIQLPPLNNLIHQHNTSKPLLSNQILPDNLQQELQKLHFLQNSPIKLGEYEYKLNDLLSSSSSSSSNHNNSILTSNNNNHNHNHQSILLQKSLLNPLYSLNTNTITKNNNYDYYSNTNNTNNTSNSSNSTANSHVTGAMNHTNTVSSPNIDLLCRYYLQNNNNNNIITKSNGVTTVNNHPILSSKATSRSSSDRAILSSNCNSTTDHTKKLSNIDCNINKNNNNNNNNIILKTPSQTSNNYHYPTDKNHNNNNNNHNNNNNNNNNNNSNNNNNNSNNNNNNNNNNHNNNNNNSNSYTPSSSSTNEDLSSSVAGYCYNWTGSTVDDSQSYQYLGVDVLTPAGLPQCTPMSIAINNTTITNTTNTTNTINSTKLQQEYKKDQQDLSFITNQNVNNANNNTNLMNINMINDDEDEDVVTKEHQQNNMMIYNNILNDPFYETPDDLFFNTMMFHPSIDNISEQIVTNHNPTN